MLVPHCTTPSDTQSMLFRGIVHAYLCDPAFLFAFLSANRSQVDVSSRQSRACLFPHLRYT